ncbi:MAG: hypothetical protein SGJ18_00140 [Pseudomonadota bacterium]|nr:hypothetical protein [Pseudomonadota bacterium]
MEMNSEVLIVSAYGRGHWLAADLSLKGFKVALADITGNMGRWTPADWEGPFGIFRTDRMESLQVSCLLEDSPQEKVESGFSLWWDKGPLELKGPLYKYQFLKSGLSVETERYLMQKGEKKGVAGQEFHQKWLADLCHQAAANVYLPSHEGMNYGSALPIFDDYSLRQSSLEGLERSLSWCKSQGVQVIPKVKIDDLYFEGKVIGGVELSCANSGLYRTKYLIWCLSSEESQRTPDSVHGRLFPRGAISPQWNWMRYRVVLDSDYFNDLLPSRFMLIENIYLSWTHSNLSFVQKTVKKGDYDVWMRVPSSQRFQGAYLKSLGDELTGLFERKLPGSKTQVQDMPQDYYYDYSELGACPYPVFENSTLDRLKTGRYNNVYFDGPEYWENMNVNGRYRYQQQIRDDILAIKMKETKERQ